METEDFYTNADTVYPVLIIPKTCTSLETNCDASDNIFINLTITSPDNEGNEACLYTGFCNIKLIDKCDIVQDEESVKSASPDRNNMVEIAVPDNGSTYPAFSQSQVWMDPAISPFVYNSCNPAEPMERYSIYQSHSNHITVEQHNTFITQNVYNYKDPVHYAYVDEFEHKKYRKGQTDTTNQYNLSDQNILHVDGDYQCGVFFPNLSEEIGNEQEIRAREEMKYIGLQTDNEALKQLMSSDVQSMTKPQKTILFLGQDSHCGQTIQKIAVNNPFLECSDVSQNAIDYDVNVVAGESSKSKRNQKKYQCDKCSQIFDQITEFNQHMVAGHRSPRKALVATDKEKFMCLECGKRLKNQQKFDLHCLGHGDPDYECSKCHKVYASKFTLRTHSKIHQRKHFCNYCSKSYNSFKELKEHAAKIHFVFMCHLCAFTADSINHLKEHNRSIHAKLNKELIEIEYNGDDPNGKFGTAATIPKHFEEHEIAAQNITVVNSQDEISSANTVIAKVVSNQMFLRRSKKRRGKKYNNICDVCSKHFDRMSDLKRHLIEHVIRSTLAKNPVNKIGGLNIPCEVCKTKTFSKIDQYKSHLREHAKLTLYKCTFCNKSFSDSSNFSKHKKIHGLMYFQCDLCQRKFNSKKMLTQHMEYHNKNQPLQCLYCDKQFHFESSLNKHIKCAHSRDEPLKFRCRFCHKYFKCLKDKWDHEWTVHHVRKMIVDCMICGVKFRKYSELKRHCFKFHNIEIRPAKKLL